MSLFDTSPISQANTKQTPLAERMRPRTLDDYAGQQHLLGPGKPLRLAIENDDPASMIFWGPPGVGKTTLAKIIAVRTQASFIEFSAVLSGIKEIKQVMVDAEKASHLGSRTILFIDEIHRFNKAQQDAFLPYVERGTIRLIGATTENPSFEINAALLSRCRVYTLQPLSEQDILQLLNRALLALATNSSVPHSPVSSRQTASSSMSGSTELPEPPLQAPVFQATPEALTAIAAYASGDARTALNALEIAAQLALSQSPPQHVILSEARSAESKDPEEANVTPTVRTTNPAPALITPAIAAEALQRRTLLYDKKGEAALRHHLRPPQIRPQLRPRRRPLLARPHARSRRRPHVRRPPHRPHGRRGHRPRRP